MSEGQDQRPHVVLLVDDELRTTRRMAEMLREDGFAVEIARDGAAAVARLSRSPVPDALVTELTTAHADGLAIGRFARNQRPGMPILILTGYPNLFHAEAFAGGPPATLFTKPVDYGALKAALRDALQASKAKDPAIDPAIASQDLTVPPELESIAENARRNALSGAQAVRALRRP
ncbi:MAG TPA: response regulator [Polyangiaceae bacterium]|jgi:two-component system response regulator MprA|nr:response regulator [Polyangiaceae bacterium]